MGPWTVTDGRSMYFSLYTDDLDIEGTEATFISMAQLGSANSGSVGTMAHPSAFPGANLVTGGEAMPSCSTICLEVLHVIARRMQISSAPGIAKGIGCG